MLSEYRQPRWGWVYLVVPLAAVLFWLVRQVHASDTVHRLLEIAVMLVVWAYVEVWQRINLVALIHHPFLGFRGWPLYREREAVPPGTTSPAERAALGSFYSDLFSAPITIWEPEPSAAAEPTFSGPAVGPHDGGTVPKQTTQAEGAYPDA